MTHADQLNLVLTGARYARVRDYAGTANPEFLLWLAKVDAIIGHKTGLSFLDLPDYNYRDAFDDGETPKGVALTVLDDAMTEAGW